MTPGYEKYLEKMTDYVIAGIGIDPELLPALRSRIKTVLQQVERDSRHSICDMIQGCYRAANEHRPLPTQDTEQA